MFYTYILYSKILNKYYSGSTSDLVKRLNEHNSGKTNFTRQSKDLELIKHFEFESKTEALKLENKIKARGCKSFLESHLTESSGI